MKIFILLLLRISICSLLLLPLLKPFVDSHGEDETPQTLTVLLATKDLQLERGLEKKVLNLLQQNYSGKNFNVNFQYWGSSASSTPEDLEELGNLLESTRGEIFILPRNSYWGTASSIFANKIAETAAAKEKRLKLLPREKLLDVEVSFSHATYTSPQLRSSANAKNFVVLNDVFLPKASFLGEETIATLHFLGRSSDQKSTSAELALYSGSDLLNTEVINLEANEQGIVDVQLPVKVNFVKPGTQTFTVKLSSALAIKPYSVATTTVTVHYAKSTFLHIGVGPDWSLRSLRQKIKFWPNLELLSYYILREMSDDMSIPPNQLSLIEFPADKLFGSQLPNFHGVIAQNFYFDAYLNTKDTENLIDYVQKGGRFFFQGGPLSFRTRIPRLAELFPCENEPTWDLEKTYRWKATGTSVTTDGLALRDLEALSTGATATNCKVKADAFVLASTVPGDHPLLIARPMGKGLVLSLLSGDWHTNFMNLPEETEIERTLKQARTKASDALFQWIVEFLQRRQDGGLRPPDIASSRIFVDENFLLLRPRGPLRLDKTISVTLDQEKWGSNYPKELTWLGLTGLRLRPAEVAKTHTIPTQAPREEKNSAIGFQFAEDTNLTSSENKSTTRPLIWPLFEGTQETYPQFDNPILWKQVETLGLFLPTTQNPQKIVTQRPIPLLLAYPWIMALTLGLLLLERFFVHAKGWQIMQTMVAKKDGQNGQ